MTGLKAGETTRDNGGRAYSKTTFAFRGELLFGICVAFKDQGNAL